MNKFLVYNFSGEVDEISHLFPLERLARIAAIIKKQGKEVSIIDRANFHDLMTLGEAFMQNLGSLSFHESNPSYEARLREEAERIRDEEADCIFMYLWHGTGFKFSLDLLSILKELDPHLKVYGIGQKVDEFTRHIFRFTGGQLDGLVTGLGYNAIEHIVQGRHAGHIPNTILRSGDRVIEMDKETIQVDEFPPPVYDEQTYRNVKKKVPIYPITLSNQACPNRCVFCIRPANYGRTVKRRKIETVLRELKDLRFDHGVTHFRVEDSTPPRGSLTQLAAAIVDSDLCGDIALSAFCRVDKNSTEDFGLMREAGFVSLFFGLESLDDDNLRRLKKGIDYASIAQTLKKAHDAGIHTVGSFIFPTPGETRKSMRNTLDRILQLREFLDSAVVLPAGVQPHTEWARRADSFGIKLGDNYIDDGVIYPIKYLVPLKHWKPFPFSYPLMGRTADEVQFDDVVRIQEEFIRKIRQEFRIPGIPDYYFLIADLLKREPQQLIEELVGCMMKRDYEAMRTLFFETQPLDACAP